MTADPVIATVHIDAPPERVYEYFTRADAIVTWMGDYALLEASPGGQFTVDVKGAPVRGRFLALDPPHRILISWGYAGLGPAAARGEHGRDPAHRRTGRHPGRARAPRLAGRGAAGARQRLDALPPSA